MDNLSEINYSSDTMEPDHEGSVARQKVAVHDDWMGVVRTEERSNLLRELVWAGLGTDDVENFMDGQCISDLKVAIGRVGIGTISRTA